VIFYAPYDSDLTEEGRSEGYSPDEGRRRGAGGLGDHGEGVPASFDGEEVLDGVQGVAASSKT
jgi:hypothetical protein